MCNRKQLLFPSLSFPTLEKKKAFIFIPLFPDKLLNSSDRYRIKYITNFTSNRLCCCSFFSVDLLSLISWIIVCFSTFGFSSSRSLIDSIKMLLDIHACCRYEIEGITRFAGIIDETSRGVYGIRIVLMFISMFSRFVPKSSVAAVVSTEINVTINDHNR